MIFLIIASAKAFSQILAISGGTRSFVEIVVGLQPIHYFFMVMQVIPLILGCFIDQISIMLITIPIFLPLLMTAGFDPIWFWCLFLINMTVGAITPPFGYILFTLKATTPSTPLEEVYRAAIPMVLIVLLLMVFVVLFPEIAIWLPNRMG
jgi:TRAP-type C4-dicarboxylate transport system permease large subunit